MSSEFEDVGEHEDVKPLDPIRMSRQAEVASGAEPKSRKPFFWLVLATAFCIISCKSCSRLMTHPSEFVLGSPPGAYRDAGQLEKRQKDVSHDADLFWKCLRHVLQGKEPHTQAAEFKRKNCGTFGKRVSTCVKIIETFDKASEELVSNLGQYVNAWTNTGALVIYPEQTAPDERRGWSELIADAACAQRRLEESVKLSSSKFENVLGGLEYGENGEGFGDSVLEVFRGNLGVDAPFMLKLFRVRDEQIRCMREMLKMLSENRDVITEDEDGAFILPTQELTDRYRELDRGLRAGDREIAKALGHGMETSDESKE